jgi:hypothetical protein
MTPGEILAAIEAWLTRPLFSIGPGTVSLGSILLAILFLGGIWWFAGALERNLNRFARRHSDASWKFARIHMLNRLLRYGVWVVGTLVALNYIGIDLTGITLLGSAFAVGLGFGLQNIVSNFVSGVIILLEQSLKVGDFVDLQSGVRGHVREIAMRYTRVSTNDSLDVLVPNSEFINGRVSNWTLDDSHRRMHVPFGVAYGTDKERVRDAARVAAAAVPGIVDVGAHQRVAGQLRRQRGELRTRRLGQPRIGHAPGLHARQADVGAGRCAAGRGYRDSFPAARSARALGHAAGAHAAAGSRAVTSSRQQARRAAQVCGSNSACGLHLFVR